ncbi:MAG: hypothetical protein PCFJNLEI_01917 [Verrucomicrobiae bacterium]|nr:hypothetical protein [Verrucomicrobiae bacterium]
MWLLFHVMSTVALPKLTCRGYELDLSAAAFGQLRRSDDITGDGGACRERMREDGYLFLPGLLDVEQVLAARAGVIDRLAARGWIDETQPRMEGVAKPGGASFMPEILVRENKPLLDLLYTGAMLEFYGRFLGGEVRHFDYTWFRSVPGGEMGTQPHCDIVYMGRGTFNLFTSWTPIGEVPMELGGLMILENSHRQQEKLKKYLSRDVDAYCRNYPDGAAIESGSKQWQNWDGRLSSNPVTLREKLGGRWLTTNFAAGDVLVFSMATVHTSLDNQTNRYRLSSDSRHQLASEPADERWIGENPIAHGAAGKRGKIC